MRRSLAVLALLFCGAQPCLAETPFQFAAPALRAPDDPEVNGLRLSVIYGETPQVRGLDLGLVSISETARMSGMAAVLGVSWVTQEMYGLSSALVNVHSSSDRGLNAAFINLTRTMENGMNFGFVNVADEYTMIDFGGFNMSDSSTAQIGFLNITRELKSFQFGFLNMAENGFLPIFPIFNFPKGAVD